MAIGAGLISGLGKAAKISGAVGSSLSGRAAMTAIAGGAFVAGIANKAGPAAMDATMEAAFGDPNADRYFTGRDLSLRTMVGGYLGGNIGTAMQMSSPGDFATTNAIMPPNPLVSGTIGAGTGTAMGIGLGGLLSKNKKVKGALIGGIIGMVGGGLIGAGGSAAAPMAHMRNNQQFFSQSPYSPMLGTSGNLNATGDIVLGMHNARRGY